MLKITKAGEPDFLKKYKNIMAEMLLLTKRSYF